MRLLLQGEIIENGNPNKTNYNHEMYGMILTNISTTRAKKIHTKARFKRLFTFSNLYVVNRQAHFYISGEDELIQDFINCIMLNQLVRIGDKVISINNITPLKTKLNANSAIIKSDFIINEMDNGKVCLSTNLDYISKRIVQIAIDKYKEIYGDELSELKAEILKTNKKYTKYKDHHLNSYKGLIKLEGDSRLIDLIYNVGLGENTASGHGFVWEA